MSEERTVTREEVNELLHQLNQLAAAFRELLEGEGKLTVKYAVGLYHSQNEKQSILNQNMLQRIGTLERELNQTKEALTNSRRAYKELVSKMAGNGT